MRRFNRYMQNLCVIQHEGSDYIMSYTTRVAKINYGNMTAEVLGYWSQTTSKHINYACQQLGLSQVKSY
jgi:hypothetical protein